MRRFVRQREAALPRLKATATEDEVAAAMGIPIDRYRRLSQIARSSKAEQRNGSAGGADSCPPTAYSLTLRREINDAVDKLPERQRRVVLALG